MKIMCLNGWGGKLYDKLLPYLTEENPDILCLQEVVHTPVTEKDWLTYKDGNHILPQRANFFRDVQTVLPNHIGIFCPASQGILWDKETKIPSQWGLATFVRKSYPIIEQIQGFVHKSYSPYEYGEHPRSRNAHAVKVFDYKENRTVVVAHMHGLRDLNGKMDTPERAVQAQKLMSLTNELSEKNDALVICGDFNVEPDSETLKILSKAGLTELVTTRTTKGTRNSQYKKKSKFADYMLVNEHINVFDFKVIFNPEVSDHCPLLLTI
ncbi:endonuclease/exonuclease/phosphatase family protein [Abyssalbus ytuae]|uniref:Endonuclease/exonuclease/phosphatase family protein n=1 Tax=Abyssalbus ytuae TaxID=2926907 RepID=A0A9E7CTT2_9FLAO|nr:endonuclease/exonuclease/phosphatase family protein [Abyssalbus ytuae]UOB18626.1 endonuclease/exonuclease/phosphatase family protein [Abyssalbus ytuae]